MMNAAFLVFVRRLSLSLAAVSLAGWFSSALCAAGLEWTQTTIEAAATFQQTDVKASFRFRNAGNRSVTITSVNSSCDCTTAELEKKTYAPGESGRLEVMFEIGDYSGEHDAHVLVSTDIPSLPPTDLILRVHIPEYLRIFPHKVTWLAGGDGSEKTVLCTAVPNQAVEILEANSSDPDLTVRIEALEQNHRYVLHLQPKSTVRHLAATIQLRVVIAGVGTRTFNAYADIMGP